MQNSITITHRFTLTANERLKSRKLIELLFREGQSLSSFPIRMIYLMSDCGTIPLQAGFTVSSKKFKKAVDRNRIKRLMKEAYRLQKFSIAEKLRAQHKFVAFFFIYLGNAVPGFQDTSIKISGVLKKLEKVIDENIASIS